MNRVSIIIPVYQSHAVFAAQLRNVARSMDSDWEAIFVDDTSDPPLAIGRTLDDMQPREIGRVRLVRMADERDWTQPRAKNFGASIARGRYLLFCDVDHFLLPGGVGRVRRLLQEPCDKMIFPRRYAALDPDGRPILEPERLTGFGLPMGTPLELPPPPGVFLVRADWFKVAGWWNEQMIGSYQPEDEDFNRRFAEAFPAAVVVEGPAMGVYPNAGRLHDLSRGTTCASR